MAKRQAISPVIATVIIVAVTIAVAIAVAFWMTGIIGLFTGFEQLTIDAINAVPTILPGGFPGWEVSVTVTNRGTSPTSITHIYINGYLAWDIGGIIIVGCPALFGVDVDPPAGAGAIPFNPGESRTITLTITKGGTCGPTTLNPGGSVEVKLHTSGGKDYPKLVVLP
ncbi:DUF4352 domain-containing protein [Infirmifilum lucidum]|uniref:DUF4352 domain-containing protein n=1 Tax=Infirmifilum lucidum TaxID=2776706 RepID=A0A7L9FHD3_9CREN|nr:archaellin/type IV pilin N-terminal domain-containing protein [Infirmifilum lucidum]QOJ79061.1 DUF4352 domain-containing protein [Infirmifilum lucidum]